MRLLWSDTRIPPAYVACQVGWNRHKIELWTLQNIFMKNLKSIPLIRPKQVCLTASLLMLFVSLSHPSYGQSQQELLFFTSVDALEKKSDSDADIEDSFVRPAVDILYSYSGENFRFLTEYLWSSSENELERMKAGWQTGDSSMLWLGRFHSTAKYWTTEYHHGQFLQTPITRPSIDEWEDESGPTPSHITGLSFEHESAGANESAIDYAFSFGLGPRFIGEELIPFDLLDPESDHDLAVNYRMVYKPDVISPNQFGLLAAWNEIDVESESNPALADLDHIKQITLGLFGDWNWDEWRLLMNIVYFDNDMQFIGETQKDEFVAGYVQAEYKISPNWTIFGRAENGFDDEDSPYLDMLPEYIARKTMLGARWDFAKFQSFTIEIADAAQHREGQSDVSFKEVRIQWSAVFP